MNIRDVVKDELDYLLYAAKKVDNPGKVSRKILLELNKIFRKATEVVSQGRTWWEGNLEARKMAKKSRIIGRDFEEDQLTVTYGWWVVDCYMYAGNMANDAVRDMLSEEEYLEWMAEGDSDTMKKADKLFDDTEKKETLKRFLKNANKELLDNEKGWLEAAKDYLTPGRFFGY